MLDIQDLFVSTALVVLVRAVRLNCVWPFLLCSTDKLPFVTMGSGSLAAMAVMESGFKDDMTVRTHECFVTCFVHPCACCMAIACVLCAGG